MKDANYGVHTLYNGICHMLVSSVLEAIYIKDCLEKAHKLMGTYIKNRYWITNHERTTVKTWPEDGFTELQPDGKGSRREFALILKDDFVAGKRLTILDNIIGVFDTQEKAERLHYTICKELQEFSKEYPKVRTMRMFAVMKLKLSPTDTLEAKRIKKHNPKDYIG